MTLYSYHVSHEQFAPAELLELVQKAEAAGFDAAFSSDHLQPWSVRQGESGFAWAWLGAALQATRRLAFGVITVPGGWRYHPVVLAQAIATLGQMFPGRIPWVALGSGEALNERVVGGEWPGKDERNARLHEGAEIIRALLAGETVSRRGRLDAVQAKVWSRPAAAPRLVGAATSAATAEWLGGWADGLLTTSADLADLRTIIAAFRRGGGAGKPIHLKAEVSWAPTDDAALDAAHDQWRYNLLGGDASWELCQPADFERATRFVRREDMHASVFVSSALDANVAWLRERAALGCASIDIHNVGRNQAEFIAAFGAHVLPRLRETAA
jgi:probable non-F420 flavinoid oxidoreductase